MAQEFVALIDERDENERKEKIKQLQKYLREIAKKDNRIPLLVIDGLFLEETKRAVEVFQEIYGISITGEVDEETWNRIYKEYVDIVGGLRSCLCLDVLKNKDAQLNQGESGYIIYFIQVMLKRISEKYSNFPEIQVTGIVDENTAKSLDIIREIHNLQSNVTDDEIIDAVAIIYCSVSQ